MKAQNFIIGLIITGIPVITRAQTQDEVSEGANLKKAISIVHADLFTGGSLMSFNYEQLFMVQNKTAIAANAGLGYTQEFQICVFGPCNSSPASYLTLPHQLTFNAGNGRHFLEFGLGGTYVFNGNPNYYVYPIIGYRMVPPKHDIFSFRVFFQYPLNGLENTTVIFVPVGLSFGAAFR